MICCPSKILKKIISFSLFLPMEKLTSFIVLSLYAKSVFLLFLQIKIKGNGNGYAFCIRRGSPDIRIRLSIGTKNK